MCGEGVNVGRSLFAYARAQGACLVQGTLALKHNEDCLKERELGNLSRVCVGIEVEVVSIGNRKGERLTGEAAVTGKFCDGKVPRVLPQKGAAVSRPCLLSKDLGGKPTLLLLHSRSPRHVTSIYLLVT